MTEPGRTAPTTAPFRPNTDELIGHNRAYADRYDAGHLPVAPARRLAVVACMDSRMDIFELLGLANGDAHIIRNAGGVITDDVIRSLAISQRLLGTIEVILLHHTDCGLQKITDDAFRAELEADTGLKPTWSVEGFSDPFADTAQSIRRLRTSPFVPHLEHVRGFVFDVDTGLLHEVEP